MSKNFYDDNNFKNLLNDLKNLPKVDAPSDFEFKLFAKIKNESFGQEKSDFSLFGFLKPAFSIVVILLVFFVFTFINQNEKTGKIIQPNLNNPKAGSVSDSQKSLMPEKKVEVFSINKKSIPNEEVVLKSKKNINFPGKTFDIDNALKSNNKSVDEHSVLAGSKQFDGFGMGIPLKDRVIDSMKQKLDSIRASEKK